MDCPNCSSNKVKYKVSRKKLWGGHRSESSLTRKTDARTDFKAKCNKCGWEGEIPE